MTSSGATGAGVRLADTGQVDVTGLDHWRGDHEDHQQHQHHVDVGHDIDLVHQASLAHGRYSQVALQDVGELLDEALETHRQPVDVVGEAVVRHHGRDGGEQADGGGDQRLGDARRNGGERRAGDI